MNEADFSKKIISYLDHGAAKLRAGGAETIDLISPSSDAATAIIEAGLASPLDLKRVPSYGDAR